VGRYDNLGSAPCPKIFSGHPMAEKRHHDNQHSTVPKFPRFLRASRAGIGTNEDIMIMLLTTRDNEAIAAAQTYFEGRYDESLVDKVDAWVEFSIFVKSSVEFFSPWVVTSSCLPRC